VGVLLGRDHVCAPCLLSEYAQFAAIIRSGLP
jgi:hypothetical protein